MLSSKRNIFLFVLLFAVVAAASWFTWLSVRKPDLSPYDVIPQSAGLVVKANDAFDALDQYLESDIWNYDADMGKIKEQLLFVSKICDEPFDLKEHVSDYEIYFSLHSDKDEKPGLVMYIPENSDLTLKRFEQILADDFENNCLSGINENGVRNLVVQGFEPVIYYDEISGMLVLSFSPELITQVREHCELKKTPITELADFDYLSEVSGKNTVANVFVNYANLPDALKLFAEQKYFSNILNIKDFATWTALDLTAGQNEVLLNGYTVVNDSLHNFLKCFQGQKPFPFIASRVIPNDCHYYVSLRFDTFTGYHNQFVDYKSNQDDADAFFSLATKMNSKYAVKTSTIDKWIGNEITLFAYGDKKRQGGNLAAIHLKDKALAKQALIKMAKKSGKGSYIVSYKNHRIRRIKEKGFVELLCGDLGTGIDQHYFSIIGDFVVFGNSEPELKTVIDKYNAEQVLATFPPFQSFAENFAREANFSIGVLHPQSIARYVSEKLSAEIRAKKWLNKTTGVGMQFVVGDNIFFTNIFTQYISDVKKLEQKTDNASSPKIEEQVLEEKEVVRKAFARLDAPIEGVPQIVHSHRSDNNRVAAFDINNNMYLFDEKGTQLSKTALKEKPLSKIYEVDAYKNRKIQYLFNTRSYLYLIDINGSVVRGYPKKLPNKAAGPITVFDYNRKRNYRIFYGGENRKLYNINVKGKAVKGWKRPGLNALFSGYAQRLIIGRKDYLLFPLESGQIFISDRRGATRIPMKGKVRNSLHTDFFENKTNSKGEIISTDNQGRLFYLNRSGKLNRTVFQPFTDKHFFIYDDFNHDGANDFIYVDEKRLVVLNRYKKKKLEYYFENPIEVKPVLIKSGARHILAVTDAKNYKVYLFNHKGLIENYSGFKGWDQISCGKLDSQRMVVLSAVGDEIYKNELP